jgi:hypothetical protein
MIDLRRAKKIAQSFLDIEFKDKIEVKIIENEVMEIEFGWLLFYNSKKAIETNDFRHQLSANYPLLVNRYTTEVVEIISDDVDSFLEEYYQKNKNKWDVKG